MRKIKLCRIIFEFAPRIGGSITHTIELSCHMSPHLGCQFIIAPQAEVNTAELDKSFPFEVHRVKYCHFRLLSHIKAKLFRWLPVAPLVSFCFALGAIKKAIRLNKEFGVDIYQGHGAGAGMAATIAGKLAGKPVVWMMHGTGLAYSKASGAYETLLTRLFTPDHLLILDDGSPAPEKFSKMFENKVTIVYHGIDGAIYSPKLEVDSIRASLKLNAGDFVILSPHSLIPVKGIEYAVRAFAYFFKLSQSNNAVLLLAGDGALHQSLQMLVEELSIVDSVRFLGGISKDNMTNYYAIADVVVATSLYSNMNRSVQEAMACAKPVVAFGSGGTNKTVIDGQTGLLAKPGDAEELARKLQVLYQDVELRTRLGQNARTFIMKERSWESRVAMELGVYEKLLKQESTTKTFIS